MPPESALWNRFEQTAREVFASYGFGEIRLPIFEKSELFARSVGAETDIVAKEMYTFEDRERVEIPLPKSISELMEVAGTVERFWKEGKIPRTIHNQDLALRLVSALTKMAELLPKMGRGDPDATQEMMASIKEMNLSVLELSNSIHEMELGYQLTLRPEATASVCRAYIEHGMQTLPGSVKLYYIGPMFRRERPQNWALPAVLPDRRGSAGAIGCAGDRC